MLDRLALVTGDSLEVLKTFADGAVRCCVTSPPYFHQRDYGVEGQIGQDATPEIFIERLVEVFHEVKRVLADDGTLWVNIGDSAAASGKGGGGSFMAERKGWDALKTGFRMPTGGLKRKDLIGIPWMLAFALRADGWYLRQDIHWHKTNCLPESVKDRFTRAHEYVFLLSKQERYYFDYKAVEEPAVCGDHARNGTPQGAIQAPGQARQSGLSRRRTEGAAASWRGSTFSKGKTAISQIGAQTEDSRKNASAAAAAARADGGRRVRGFQDRWDAGEKSEMRRKRNVWSISSEPYKGAHHAPMPTKLVEPCILAGSAPGDVVLDPFFGSGTVGVVALRHGRKFVGIDLDPRNVALAEERIAKDQRKENPCRTG